MRTMLISNHDADSGGLAHRFTRHQLAVVGLIVLVLIVLGAIFGPAITHQDPSHISLEDILANASGHHWLGADELGRDEFTRLLVGGRGVLLFGALILLVATALGAGVLAVARGSSAKPNRLLARAPEFLLAPVGAIVLVVVTAAIFQTQLPAARFIINPIQALVVPVLALEGLRLGYFLLSGLPPLKVLARGPEFLLAPLMAILLLALWFHATDRPGLANTSTAVRWIVPVVVVGVALAGGFLLVYFMSRASRAQASMEGKKGSPHPLAAILQPALVAGLWLAGDAVLIMTVMNFFQPRPPTADWGMMLADSLAYIVTRPVLWYAPMVAVLATVLSLNLIGFGLRRDNV